MNKIKDYITLSVNNYRDDDIKKKLKKIKQIQHHY